MPPDLEGEGGASRLNPFALPDESRSRYRLMVLAALVFTIAIWSALREFVFPSTAGPLSGVLPPTVTPASPDFLSQHQAYAWRLLAGLLTLTWPGALGVAAVLWMARTVSDRYPQWLRRRNASVPVAQPPGPAAPLVALIDAANRDLGGGRPALELTGSMASQHAQVFGSDSAPVLLLGRGLQLQAVRASADTNAVLHHELAHIANGDVGRTYRAWGVFLSTAALTVAPLLLVLVGSLAERLMAASATGAWGRFLSVNLPSALFGLVQLAGGVLMLVLALAGFLRARETYADWRAATWGHGDRLVQILQRNRQGTRATARWVPSLHPTAAERLAVLREPARLFMVGDSLTFQVGVLAGLALPTFALYALEAGLALSALGTVGVTLLASSGQSLMLAFALLFLSVLPIAFGLLVPGALVAYFVSGALGLAVQRWSVAGAAGAHASGYQQLWRPAAALVVGVQLGALLVPVTPVSPLSGFLLQAPAGANPAPVIPWSLAAVVSAWLCLASTHYWSKRFLGRHLGLRPPVWKRRLGAGLFSMMLAPVLVALLAGQWVSGVPASMLGLGRDEVMVGPLAFGGFVLLTGSLAVSGFGGGWLLWTVARLFERRAHCQSCGAPLVPGTSVAVRCAACGRPAADWLLTPAASYPAAASEAASAAEPS